MEQMANTIRDAMWKKQYVVFAQNKLQSLRWLKMDVGKSKKYMLLLNSLEINLLHHVAIADNTLKSSPTTMYHDINHRKS